MEPKCTLPYIGHVNRMGRKRKVNYEDNKKETDNITVYK